MFISHLQLSIRRQSNNLIIRCTSSSRSKRAFQLDALPFYLSPSDAYAKFERWGIEQGIGPLLSIGSTKLTAAYTPFWYFKLNVRFIEPRTNSLATPQPFRSAYPNAPNGVIHLPGLSAYAGYTYRRSLIDPTHNTTPVFMQKDIVVFGQWMLEPLKFNNEELEIYPDPWNATRERSYSVIYDELQTMANEQYQSTDTSIIVESERLSSRRIYLPTYIVEYKILGITYTACISGCDKSISVSGVSHKTIFSSGSTVDKAYEGASSFLSSLPQKLAPAAGGALQFFGLRPFIAIVQVGMTIISRIAMKFHLVAPFVGAFVAYRKLFRPYMDERNQTADWERQREYEATKTETYHEDSFRDTGSAKRYFTRNHKRILSTLSGEEGRQHGEESNEWYNQWEEWAKQQFEEAQRQASRAQEEWMKQLQQQQYGQGRTYQQYEESRQYKQQQQQQQQSQRQYKQAKNDDDFKWDFDVSDPYSVLGIKRNTTKEEVSKAFRRNMLKYHPDVAGQNAIEKEKRKATERSKLISDAYRKIKASLKK